MRTTTHSNPGRARRAAQRKPVASTRAAATRASHNPRRRGSRPGRGAREINGQQRGEQQDHAAEMPAPALRHAALEGVAQAAAGQHDREDHQHARERVAGMDNVPDERDLHDDRHRHQAEGEGERRHEGEQQREPGAVRPPQPRRDQPPERAEQEHEVQRRRDDDLVDDRLAVEHVVKETDDLRQRQRDGARRVVAGDGVLPRHEERHPARRGHEPEPEARGAREGEQADAAAGGVGPQEEQEHAGEVQPGNQHEGLLHSALVMTIQLAATRASSQPASRRRVSACSRPAQAQRIAGE